MGGKLGAPKHRVQVSAPPTFDEMLGSKVAIHTRRGNWDLAHGVIDEAEAEAHRERLSKPLLKLEVCLLPRMQPDVADVMRTAGVETIGEFLEFFRDGTLHKTRGVTERSIRTVLEAIRLLGNRTTEPHNGQRPA